VSKCVLGIGIKLYNPLPSKVRKLKRMQHSKRELGFLLLQHRASCYSVDEFLSHSFVKYDAQLFVIWKYDLFYSKVSSFCRYAKTREICRCSYGENDCNCYVIHLASTGVNKICGKPLGTSHMLGNGTFHATSARMKR